MDKFFKEIISELQQRIPLAVETNREPIIIKAVDLENGTIYSYSCYPCPTCGKWIHHNPNYIFCPCCGQKLDWK